MFDFPSSPAMVTSPSICFIVSSFLVLFTAPICNLDTLPTFQCFLGYLNLHTTRTANPVCASSLSLNLELGLTHDPLLALPLLSS